MNGELNNITILTFRGDYFFHSILFSFFIPIIWFGSLNGVKTLSLILYVFIGLIFATLSEVLQLFVPYRAFNINDMIANCLGIILGFWSLFFGRKERI